MLSALVATSIPSSAYSVGLGSRPIAPGPVRLVLRVAISAMGLVRAPATRMPAVWGIPGSIRPCVCPACRDVPNATALYPFSASAA